MGRLNIVFSGQVWHIYVRTYIHTYIHSSMLLYDSFVYMAAYVRLYAMGLPCVCTVHMSICAYIIMYVCMYVCIEQHAVVLSM